MGVEWLAIFKEISKNYEFEYFIFDTLQIIFSIFFILFKFNKKES